MKYRITLLLIILLTSTICSAQPYSSTHICRRWFGAENLGFFSGKTWVQVEAVDNVRLVQLQGFNSTDTRIVGLSPFSWERVARKVYQAKWRYTPENSDTADFPLYKGFKRCSRGTVTGILDERGSAPVLSITVSGRKCVVNSKRDPNVPNNILKEQTMQCTLRRNTAN